MNKQKLASLNCEIDSMMSEIAKATNEIAIEMNKMRKGFGHEYLAKEYGVPIEVIGFYYKKYKNLPLFYYTNEKERTKTYDLLKLLEREMKLRKLKKKSNLYIFRKLFNWKLKS